jgi:hypothetical protein
MRAPAALTTGHRSKRASGAGSAFTAPQVHREWPTEHRHQSRRARNPRTSPSIDCHGMIRSLVGHYSRSQASPGLHTDERLLSSCWRPLRS